MKEKAISILVAVLALGLATAVAAVCNFQVRHVIVQNVAYPKDAVSLDLRDVELSVEEFDVLRSQMPDCEILWNVPFQDTWYPSDTTDIVILSLSDADVERLDYITGLRRVNAISCQDYEQLLALQERRPECDVKYCVELGQKRFRESAADLVITGLTENEAGLLRYLPNARTVRLINPKADAQTVLSLGEQYPDIDFSWVYRAQGLAITQEDTEVDFSGMTIALSEVETILAYFPNVEKAVMIDCGYDNETMAVFREKMREEYKVVWTVDCGGITVRTDETSFIPIKHGVYYFHNDDVYNLRYCEDMIAVDLGHMTFTDLEWVEFMPHLKYLILAHTTVTDISSLSTCKELVFLELDWTGIRNYEPLLGCTALEDLNLGLTYGDYEIIGQMTWLKNLWWKDRGSKAATYLAKALPNTHQVFNSNITVGYGWRKLQNYYDMRDALGMYYMEG